MNLPQGVDPVALAWCLPEIRESLVSAVAELEQHLAGTPAEGHLARAADHLHRTQGALEVANARGVRVVTQEAESIIGLGEREALVIDRPAVATLKRALAAVAEYLEELQADTMLPPVVLFTFYRDLLLLRGADRIDPADLYFPDLNIQLPPEVLAPIDPAQSHPAGTTSRAARQEFERGLPAFLRGADQGAALAALHSAMERMQSSNHVAPARGFFWIAMALVDALKHGALPVDLYSKRLVARVNIQARHTLESDEPVAHRLLVDLLFALALATDQSPAAAEVRRHFRLAGTVPADFERVRYGLSDPAATLEAREAVRTLRAAWERRAGGSQMDDAGFLEAAIRLAAALRTQRHQGMAELADALAAVPPALAPAPGPDEALSLEVATAILFIDEVLGGELRATPGCDAHASSLGSHLRGVIDRSTSPDKTAPRWLVDVWLAGSGPAMLGVLVAELRANLGTCEQTLDQHFRAPSKAPALDPLRPLIAQAAGVLAAIGHPDAAAACAALEEDVSGLAAAGGVTDDLVRQHIADNLSLLGFFLDSLLQPGAQAGTFRFDKATRKFQVWLDPGEGEVAAERAEVEEGPADEAPGADEAAAQDLELLEIFLLEAEEVLEAIGRALPQAGAAADPAAVDKERLASLRRAFHTLKGSSRMVGLVEFGEAAWAFEEVLNQWVAEDRAVSEALHSLIESGREHFAKWVAQLHQSPSAVVDSAAMLARCEALMAGEPDLPIEAAATEDEKVWIGSRSLDGRLFDVFNEEGVETRRRLKDALREWQERPDAGVPEPLLRTLHSLLGSSRHVGLAQLRAIAEPTEWFLLNHAKTALPLPPRHLAQLQAALGAIDSMLEQFAQRVEPPRDVRAEKAMAELATPVSGRDASLGPDAGAFDAASDADAGPPDEIDPDLGSIFFEETDELLPQIDRSLREWQAEPANRAAPIGLMRLLHTVKGSARMAGAMRFGQSLHDIETQVEEAVGLPEVPPILIEQLLVLYDLAFGAYEVLKQPAAPQPPSPAGATLLPGEPDAPAGVADGTASVASATQAAPAGSLHAGIDADPLAGAGQGAGGLGHVIRVRADVLDRMVSESGEVSVARARLDSEMASIRQSLAELNENVNRLRAQLREIEIHADNQIQARRADVTDAPADFDPLEFDRYTRFQELTKMLAESVNDVATVQQNAMRAAESATQDLVRQGHVSRSLQQNLMRIRMVQFETVSDRLYRVVRQAAKDADKRVVLELTGGNAEIDRSVLERMAAPMEHLLRNAVAHGIESRADRIRAGKPEIGELAIDVTQEGNEVVMTFRDDGAGLDHARIEQRAHQRGLLPRGRKATERELAQLIFTPGFSTAPEVTALAGRGVGLDVVRAEVSAIGGRIDVDSTPGVGSRFSIHLPVSMAVSQVVLLGVGAAKYAVQAALVERILQVKPEMLAEAYRSHSIDCDGEAVPMYFLGSLLELPQSRPLAQQQSPVVIVRAATSRIALHVDSVVPAQEVVIKNVGPQLARLTGIAGATVLGNGDIVLILNPVQLASVSVAKEAGVGDTADFAPADFVDSATVMVVDDSVTVRKVTQRLLVREGYTVLLAKDGVDALRQLQDVVPDMMLVDIEMPRMDGFDLTRNIRASDRLRHVPIIMITSRTADKHRNQALSLGVDVFLGKPYAEDELLRQVQAFVAQPVPDPGA